MTAFFAVESTEIVTLICALLLAPGWAQSIRDNTASNVIGTSSCSESQFRCRNGDCIQSELLCDGRADCADGSDEIEAECSKPELTCPDYAFRCSYGACVNGDATCNGVQDCIDNSDETLPRCPGMSAADPVESCSQDDYRCKNGQCISSNSLCDGTIECADGSDETFESCGSFPCNQLVFRCNYGACIDGDLTCNNVSNCADGSDEHPLLCGRPEPVGPSTEVPIRPTPPKTRPTVRPTLPPITVPDPTARLSCLVPAQPPNGQWKLHKSLCGGIGGGNVDCEIVQGIELSAGDWLVYTCAPGYKIRGNPDVYCARGGSWSSLPVCVEIKCSALNSVSATADCRTRTNEWTNCGSAVLPGTRAKITCQNGYRKDTSSGPSYQENVICSGNGKWEPEPIKCVPVCGKVVNPLTPLVVNGTPANINEFPWHATLYVERKTSRGNYQKDFHCGGTILQTNLVLTAAHCVYDETTKTTENPSRLFVMTGNVFRDYDSPLHDSRIVRRGAVKNVHIYCQYLGLVGNYVADIALLELVEPFPFSSLLAPACLDVDGDPSQVLQHNARGRVSGFGRTELGKPSVYLQTLTLPYVSYAECKSSKDGMENEAFIGPDKFCAGYTTGMAVCEGDSGGGLVFKKDNLWYVMGIVSVGLGANTDNGERTCNSHSYSLYTRVDKYMAWIQQVMFELERYKSFPSCPSENNNITVLADRGGFLHDFF